MLKRIRTAFAGSQSSPAPAHSSEYQPLTTDTDADIDDSHNTSTALHASTILDPLEDVPFSWVEYTIFAFVGMAMLWAWNMFLAAAPYFSSRLAGDAWAESNYQSAILAVSTLTNLVTMLALIYMQSSASYSFRINLALVINVVIFALLAGSTVTFLGASPRAYLSFLLAMVACSAWAAGLIQNGAYAFAASFGRSEYMQALMAGQGVAGVLPPIAQIITVLAFPPTQRIAPEDQPDDSNRSSKGETSAFIYFLAAVVISAVTLVAMVPLIKRRNRIIETRAGQHLADSFASIISSERAIRKVTSPWRLFKKLHWLCLGVALTFIVTMFFPVFTAKILSVRESRGALFKPSAFVPLGFFFWNLGDLAGRIATALPFSLQHRPFVLFMLSVGRIAMVPLYFLCNIGGRGAVVSSDLFYLLVVQLSFGVTNGWLGSSFMMASSKWVDEGEREAAGGFMGLCLVIGLGAGSFLSFTASGV